MDFIEFDTRDGSARRAPFGAISTAATSKEISKDDKKFIPVLNLQPSNTSFHEKTFVSSFPFINSIKIFFTTTFLPNDYPHSVRPEYLTYQFWDSLQGASSYIRTVLTTKSLLQGAGVGSAIASPLTASLIWVAKDGVGMIGSLIFAFLFSDTFEVYAMEWRYAADCLNNIALLLDLLSCSLSTHLPQHYFYFTVLSLSTICKSCCGLIAGAAKARISAHFAREGYLADVTAKESTQETAIALIGLAVGLVVGSYVESNPHLTWSTFILLLLLHQYANYRLTKTLIFDTFNPQRVYLLTDVLFKLTSASHIKPQTSRSVKKFYFIDNSPRGQNTGSITTTGARIGASYVSGGIPFSGRRPRSNSMSSTTSTMTSSSFTASGSLSSRFGLGLGLGFGSVHHRKVPLDPFSPLYISSLEGLFTPLWLHWYGPRLGAPLGSVLPFPAALINSSLIPAAALQAIVSHRREKSLISSSSTATGSVGTPSKRSSGGTGTPSKRRKSAVKRSVQVTSADETFALPEPSDLSLAARQLETVAALSSTVWQDHPFFICLDRGLRVAVCLSQDCTDRAMLQAYFVACHLHMRLHASKRRISSSSTTTATDTATTPDHKVLEQYALLADTRAVQESMLWYDSYVEPYLDSEACLWDVREFRTRLAPLPWRYSSSEQGHEKFD